MRSTRKVWAGVALVAVAALAYSWMFRSDEARVLAVVDELARVFRTPNAGESAAERSARLERELDALVAGDVAIQIGGAPRMSGRGALAALATGGGEDLVDLELGQREVRVERGSAVVRGEGVLVVERASRLERDPRRVELGFREEAGSWFLTSLTVAAPTDEEPEARP
jgi:hypothetical protein